MMSEADKVNKRYFPTIVKNPIFKNVIADLVTAGLYTSALHEVTAPAFKSIGTYKNGDHAPNSAVPLDVIIDTITRNVLKGLRDGFNGKDAASNISLDSNIGTGVIDIPGCDNVHAAIEMITIELMAIKTALSSVTAGSFLITPNTASASAKASAALNKLILE